MTDNRENEEVTSRSRSENPAEPAERGQLGLWRSTIGFLLMPTIWPRWILFSGGLLVVLVVTAIGAHLIMMTDTGGGYSGIGPWILGMFFSSVAGAGFLLWFILFAVSGTIIAVETASGINSIEDWPDGPMQDWMPDALYVVNAILFGGLPGLLLYYLLASSESSKSLWVMPSLFILFPVVFLSMLEWGSAIQPFSRNILASLRQKWMAWSLFYVAAIAVLVPALALTVLAILTLGPVGAAPAPPLLVGALLIYFRLLGRLGAVCGRFNI